MTSLKDLGREFPAIIDSNFQRFCASHGIFSVIDFLLHDLGALTTFAEQELSSDALKKGIAQIITILDDRHQPWQNGVGLFKDARHYKNHISTGCDGIDIVLGGGLRKGQVTELAGPSSSGKTQVCLQTASYVADRNLGTVMFLDTGNSFSPKRIASIVTGVSNLSANEAKGKKLEMIMSRIFHQPVFEIFTLLELLNQLHYHLKQEENREESKLCLLIIDSISSLVTPILGLNSNGKSLMVSVGFLLKRLANQHNFAVLVINHTVGGEGGAPKPALGESWKSIPHVRLFLSRDQQSSICNISVLKHTLLEPGNLLYVVTSSRSQQVVLHISIICVVNIKKNTRCVHADRVWSFTWKKTTLFNALSGKKYHYLVLQNSEQISRSLCFSSPYIMNDPSAAYIHLVQHLIEKCLVFNMSKGESIDAISKHADIEPVIISTVWEELEKENREFFDAYEQGRGQNIREADDYGTTCDPEDTL